MSTGNTTIDARTFGIGILSVTACVLFVGLILVMQTPPVQAANMNDRGGDYIIATQQISTSLEAIVVLDAAAKRMILYAFDYNTKVLEIVQYVPVDQLPRPRERVAPPRGRG